MRAFSETVALVITAAVIISLALTMFLYSYLNVQLSNIGGEYSYSRSVLLSLSTHIGDVLRGNVLQRSYPGQRALFGSREMACKLVLRIDFSNGTSLDSFNITNYVINLGTMFPLTTAKKPESIDKYVLVRNESSLLRIYEYFENGWTYTDLVPGGILYGEYTVNASNKVVNKTIIEIIVFHPEHASGSLFRASFMWKDTIENVARVIVSDTCSQTPLLNKTGDITILVYHIKVRT